MTFNDLINYLIREARVIPVSDRKLNRTVYPDEQESVKDDEVIRVYHGFRDLIDAIRTLKYGLSGKERIGRTYSFETDNNPKGLFVSIDMNIAKDFGNYIIEFHTKVSDLEAPVWPGGGHTVQGQMSQSFYGDENREAARLKRREASSKSNYKAVSQSDRPELGETLFNNVESQALFIGTLDPNSIRAIWVNPTPEKSGRYSQYARMTRQEFLKKFGDKDKITKLDWLSGSYKQKEDDTPLKGRVLKPREKFDMNVFLDRLAKKYPQGGTPEEDRQDLLGIMTDSLDEEQWGNYLWPHQIADFKKQLANL